MRSFFKLHGLDTPELKPVVPMMTPSTTLSGLILERAISAAKTRHCPKDRASNGRVRCPTGPTSYGEGWITLSLIGTIMIMFVMSKMEVSEPS